jgi:hypothetical protein
MRLSFLLFVLLASSSLAQDRVTAVDVSNLGEGESIIVTKKAGVITTRPLTLLVLGTPNPNPNPNPNPGPLSPFATEIQRLTKAAIAKGGTETTGAGISSVYSLAADGIDAGTLDVSVAPDAVRRGTTAVVNLQKEQAAWAEFSTALDDTITTLRAKGDLKTKAQFSATFRDVAKGMDSATGFSGKPSTVVKLDPTKAGILGNIDLAKLIELIKLIMELFKLFAPMVP